MRGISGRTTAQSNWCRPTIILVLLVYVAGLSVNAGAVQASPQLTPELLGRLLGATRGCGDTKAQHPLATCIERFAKDDAMRKRLITAADKAQQSPWLERPGVCARVKIAVREMALWKSLCKDLGPPPY